MKKTLVLGASTKPSRYAYKALERLAAAGYPAVGYGRQPGEVAGMPIYADWGEIEAAVPFHTVSIYLNPQHQAAFIEPLLALQPRRLIFNPGAECQTMAQAAAQAGIETTFACTLVMLGERQF